MTLVWYAAYGSNLASERFMYYVNGGRPPGSDRTYPGCRDKTPPREDRAGWLDGDVFFAGRSRSWAGGGVAFLDPDAPGSVRARLYLVGTDQFADIVAQENQLEEVDLGDVESIVRLDLGKGWYGLVVAGRRVDARPVLTITTSARLDINTPTTDYVSYVARGLRESHELSAAEIADYLVGRRGIAGSRTREELLAIMA